METTTSFNTQKTACHEPAIARKAWATPTITESPVNELTQSSLSGSGSDGAANYS